MIKTVFLVAFVFSITVSSGCSRATEKTPVGQNVTEEKPVVKKKPDGIMHTVVDEITGRRVVYQGEQMKEKIRKIDAKRDADLDDVLNDID